MDERDEGIGAVVKRAVDLYLQAHEGGSIPSGLHRRIIREVEAAMFQSVMEFVGNNQVRASKILGIDRSTLKKKMTEHAAESQKICS